MGVPKRTHRLIAFVVLALVLHQWFLLPKTGKRVVVRLDGFHIVSSSQGGSGETTGIARDALPDGPKTFPRPNLTDNNLLQRFLIVPEYKLLFCYVEKVGCSMFNHLFRMLRIHHPDVANNTKELMFQAKFTWFRNTPRAHQIKKNDLENILVDPSWTKAVFYRDPVSRFLSAFRSKCEPGHDMNRCKKLFGSRNMTFDDALKHVERFGVSANPHLAPISDFCGGLRNTIDYYDFVHELDSGSAPIHVATLFDKIGVHKELIQSLVGRIVQSGGTDFKEDAEYVAQLGAELKYGVTQETSHATSAKKDMCEYFNTDEKVRLIEELYSVDYNTFRLSPRKLNCTR